MPKHKKKGPLSLQGAVTPALRTDVSIPLKVAHKDSAVVGRGLPAYLHPSSIQQLCSSSTPDESNSKTLFLQLASGSDCILHARASADVAPGSIQVDEVQQANLRLCTGEVYKFSVFQPEGNSADDSSSDEEDEVSLQDVTPAAAEDESSDAVAAAAAAAAAVFPYELTDVDLEVRLLHASGSVQQQRQVQVDAVQLVNAFSKQCCWRVLAVNEYVVVELPGVPPLLLRVTATNTLTLEEQQDALGYHCFRGLLTPDTTVFITAASNHAVPRPSPPAQRQQQQQQRNTDQPTAAHTQTQQQLSKLSITDVHGAVSEHSHQKQQQAEALLPVQSRVAAGGVGVQLVNAVSRAAAPAATNLVHVYTNDGDGGEWFPVKKKLLRPCIALTKAVRDSGDATPSVNVDIDTLTFDRVLIFLEAQALGRKPPSFAVHLLDDLHQAATQLGLRSLQDYCSHLKGSKQAALGVYSFADVQRANARDKVWLLLDGMVLDVGRWLPEHPGGATIIPAQSLNCDCSRFFEMYHASRESFLYLQEFYIGELVPEDIPHVPLGGKQLPSPDFLVQLREYTAFRQPMLQQLAQRVPATHLGAGKRLAGH